MKTRLQTLWSKIRPRLAFCKRQFIWLTKYLKTPTTDLVRFRCNICGMSSSFPRNEMIRDIWSCRFCSSHVRWRSVIHALSMELFGESLAIPEFPGRPELKGIGLSDWCGYGDRLERKLNYVNTYFHQAPRLDITNIDDSWLGQYDFILSSDVFEHVCQPVSNAFHNAFKLLKPGGFMILTVPYIDGETTEHFPGTVEFSVFQEGDSWVLKGTTAAGEETRYTDLTFHGGPGTTVECRLFGKESLLRDCQDAGFEPVEIYHQAIPELGIYWNPYDPDRAPYRPRIYGLDTPPWVLRKPR